MSEIKRSSFSVTCSLLSQYLKEKRSSMGDLGLLDLAPRSQELPTKGSHRPPTTLNLLPGIEASAENQTDAKDAISMTADPNLAKERQRENAQLTIFYGGKVLILDNFSPEKAADIMHLATEGSSSASIPTVNPATINTSGIPMPIARKASLHRFLEKRKDRINSKAPYQINGPPKMEPFATASEEARSWLALGQGIPNMN